MRDRSCVTTTTIAGSWRRAREVTSRSTACTYDTWSPRRTCCTACTSWRPNALRCPTSVSAWDPGLTKINDTWHLGFVESPSQRPFDFHPALAAGKPGGDWNEDLRLVGAATDLHQCEGPIIAQVQDEWWFLASDGDNRHYPVFTMDMKSVGRLDAPYRTNIPHPQIVPLEGGHLLVTFNGAQYGESVLGYGGHGDVLVMRAH